MSHGVKHALTHWRVKPGDEVDLSAIDPGDTSGLPDKKDAKEALLREAERIDALQDRLYAEHRRALLVILQGMDTSGKDGTVKAVFSACGPLGVTVTSFQKPSAEELAHDFLWRVHMACPRRGTIGIFNRSHYEDVLAGRVRGLAPADVIERRYAQINSFESVLAACGTTILKFMLHISPDEQKARLQARLDQPEKRWKFDPADLDDRALFDRYMAAYEIAIARTSTEIAPWHIIPSDHKWARNLAVALVVRRTLEGMDPHFPQPDWDPGAFTIV